MNPIRHWITLCELFEAATPHGQTFWFNPVTKQLIPCSDHGDAVIENPNAFGIDYQVQNEMEDAFPDEGGEEEEREIPDAEPPAELWGGRAGWQRNDAWETLAMNRGWVRIGSHLDQRSLRKLLDSRGGMGSGQLSVQERWHA